MIRTTRALHSAPAGLALVCTLICASLASPAVAARSDEAPAWLLEAAANPAGKADSADPKSRVVVLLDEAVTTVTGKGHKIRRQRYAVRILNNEGRGLAFAQVPYLLDGGRVRSLVGWLITPAGTVKAYGKKDVLDRALTSDTYSDYRVQQLDVEAEALPGAVFGWESEEEDRSVFLQETWSFQGLDPVVVSRYRLELPVGWQAQARTYNHPTVEPAVSGSTYTWELANLPRRELEPAGPSLVALTAWLAIDYQPADAAVADAPRFETWADVATWQDGLHESRLGADAAMRAKVAELTIGLTNTWAKVEALSRYVQSTRYVSIQVGVARGGGYQPHQAAEVFAKGYGDCKDKVNLLRALLREIGVAAHSVAAYSGDPRRVQPEWASPHQFNHALVAIVVGDEVDAPAVAAYPGLGRLVFFDPTDDTTPLGWLPAGQQDALVLVAAPTAGALVKTPAARAGDHHLDRSVEGTLADNGAFEARLVETTSGSTAAYARAVWKALTPKDYRTSLLRVLAQQVPRATLGAVDVDDSWPKFERSIELSAPTVGQRMGGSLWLLRLAFLGSGVPYDLDKTSRTGPFYLAPESRSVRVALTLPAGWGADELPPDLALDTEFGYLEATWRVETGVLQFEQKLTIEAREVPAAAYPALREFLLAAQGAAEHGVVLGRSN